MGVNVLLDALLGSILVIGDLFDFFWKSNQRNVKLLEAYAEQPRHTARASGYTVAAVVLLLGAALGALGVAVRVLGVPAGCSPTPAVLGWSLRS